MKERKGGNLAGDSPLELDGVGLFHKIKDLQDIQTLLVLWQQLQIFVRSSVLQVRDFLSEHSFRVDEPVLGQKKEESQ